MHRTKTIDGETYVSQREASQRIGVCQATMASLVSKGIIAARRISGVRSVWVRESDITAFTEGGHSESRAQAGY